MLNSILRVIAWYSITLSLHHPNEQKMGEGDVIAAILIMQGKPEPITSGTDRGRVLGFWDASSDQHWGVPEHSLLTNTYAPEDTRGGLR